MRTGAGGRGGLLGSDTPGAGGRLDVGAENVVDEGGALNIDCWRLVVSTFWV